MVLSTYMPKKNPPVVRLFSRHYIYVYASERSGEKPFVNYFKQSCVYSYIQNENGYRNLDGFFLPVTTLNYLQISFSCDTDSSIRYVKTSQSKYIYIF